MKRLTPFLICVLLMACEAAPTPTPTPVVVEVTRVVVATSAPTPIPTPLVRVVEATRIVAATPLPDFARSGAEWSCVDTAANIGEMQVCLRRIFALRELQMNALMFRFPEVTGTKSFKQYQKDWDQQARRECEFLWSAPEGNPEAKNRVAEGRTIFFPRCVIAQYETRIRELAAQLGAIKGVRIPDEQLFAIPSDADPEIFAMIAAVTAQPRFVSGNLNLPTTTPFPVRIIQLPQTATPKP